MWALFEVACIPIVLLLGRAMWQSGDGSRDNNDTKEGDK